MGRMLGVFADDEDLDRPDLNKCPDCGCFFAQEACPLCGKICPEEMRAGNRPAVKHKKKRSSNSDRVTFISWYHSWWFIVLAMLFMPLIGIVLLITSPHKQSHKILFVVIALLYTVLVSWGVGGMLIGMVRGQLDQPVDTALTQDEYIAACEPVDAQDFYRTADSRIGQKTAVVLTVREAVTDVEGTYSHDRYPN